MAEKSEGHNLRMRILDRLCEMSNTAVINNRLNCPFWRATIGAMDDVYHLHWQKVKVGL